MRTNFPSLLLLSMAGLVLILPLSASAKELPAPSEKAGLRLEELEQMALQNYPSLAQAAAKMATAEGKRIQAGLYPNPTFGYLGEEVSARNPSDRSQHYLFLEQRIVTAGKLKYGQDVFAREKVRAEADREAEKMRVLNSVRLLFYQTLGAQQRVRLRAELTRIAREAVTISQELYNVGQADRPDTLQAEIEAQQMELEQARAESRLGRLWEVLRALVGNPMLPQGRLEGNLEDHAPTLEDEQVMSRLLRESPEIVMARTGVERARASLQRTRAQRIPDILLKGGFGYNLQADESQGFLQVGVPLPLFDRNQGNIAAARAELDRAEQEVRLLELSLRARMASLLLAYRNSTQKVERYRKEILPRAKDSYELYLASFRQMAASYPQVLIAQRTLFQVRSEYVNALVDLWQTVVRIQGMLLTERLAASVGTPEPESFTPFGSDPLDQGPD